MPATETNTTVDRCQKSQSAMPQVEVIKKKNEKNNAKTKNTDLRNLMIYENKELSAASKVS